MEERRDERRRHGRDIAASRPGALLLLLLLLLFLVLLLGLSTSSGVAGMVLNITLPLWPLPNTSSIFNPTLSMTLWHKSFRLVSCLPLRLFPGTGASTILLSACPSFLLLTCPYHFSLFSVIFFVTGAGATFTDPLTCLFLILSFLVTPHVHLSFSDITLLLMHTFRMLRSHFTDDSFVTDALNIHFDNTQILVERGVSISIINQCIYP